MSAPSSATGRNRVYAHRRTPDRRLLPGSWDIIGGHLEAGETPQQALARELQDETAGDSGTSRP